MRDLLTPLRPMRTVIQERRQKAFLRNEIWQLAGNILRTFLTLVLLAVLFNIRFGLQIVHGNQMYPALTDGDLTLTYRVSSYIKNDVVFYEADGRLYVGRVVAKDGDLVDIAENGVLTVNGTPQTDEAIYPTYPPESWTGPLRVPEDRVFVLGDYRMSAADSRQFGCISLANVRYKVIAVLRHRGI